MPKITVYVPDGLVERVRALNPEVNVSQLFQAAVQSEIQHLESRQGRIGAVRAALNMAAMRAKFQAGEGLMPGADGAAYEAGYQWVLQHAEEIPYVVFEVMEANTIGPDYDPSLFYTRYDGRDFMDYPELQGLRELRNAHPLTGWRVYEGATEALQDVWDTVDADLNGTEGTLSQSALEPKPELATDELALPPPETLEPEFDLSLSDSWLQEAEPSTTTLEASAPSNTPVEEHLFPDVDREYPTGGRPCPR